MKKIINQVCTKLAKCAFHAAEVSTGTASCAGLYQPTIPQKVIEFKKHV
ncbi:AgrD family cyclic lactone autoinducer peptide [Agathobaculum sp. LCP25S3_E8]